MKQDRHAHNGSFRRLGFGGPIGAEREKILNLPPVVSWVIVALALVQVFVETIPTETALQAYTTLAFIPARFTYLFAPDSVLRAMEARLTDVADAGDIASALQSAGRAWWTPLTYAFLHGDWTHLSVNCISLAAFGSPVARRFGAKRFLSFLAVSAIAGALMHLLFHPYDLAPVVGASAAISGTMAAVARFAFTPGAPLAERGSSSLSGNGSTSLRHFASNRRAMYFIVAWFGVNLLFGMFPQAAGASSLIAWEAHLGGFLAGLLLFDFFDGYRKSGGGP